MRPPASILLMMTLRCVADNDDDGLWCWRGVLGAKWIVLRLLIVSEIREERANDEHDDKALFVEREMWDK